MAKNKPIRYYCCSQIFVSNELPNRLQGLLQREPATYRVTKSENSLTTKEKRDSREVVKKKGKVPVMSEEGVKEMELNLVEFDKSLWRFYLECSTLEQLNDFFEEIDQLGFSITVTSAKVAVDNEDFADYLECNFGLEEVAGYIIEFQDEWMLSDRDEEFEGEEAE